jgi:tetratricopeptide (TPR) repeat protein
VSEQTVDEARASYEAGDYRRAWELASRGLDDRPDDPELLRIAADVARELDDADAWRRLADILAEAGRTEEAIDAFRRAVERRPDDSAALLDLGHASFAAGRPDEAISYLEQVREREPDNPGALRALADIHRRAGRLDEAFAAADALAATRPDDVLASLEVADLALDLGRLEDAKAAFRRVAGHDDVADHDVPYALHGLIEVELRRGDARRALDLAIEATRLDRLGRTTEVLAYAVAQVFGESDRPAPDRAEIDEALALSRAEHRRLHAEEEALV